MTANGHVYAPRGRSWVDQGARNALTIGASPSNGGLIWAGTSDGKAWEYNNPTWTNYGLALWGAMCSPIWPNVVPASGDSFAGCTESIGGGALVGGGPGPGGDFVSFFYLYSSSADAWEYQDDASQTFPGGAFNPNNAPPVRKVLEGGVGPVLSSGEHDAIWLLNNPGDIWSYEK
jgi:hypothetical protein